MEEAGGIARQGMNDYVTDTKDIGNTAYDAVATRSIPA
jgi:hypothetical protein